MSEHNSASPMALKIADVISERNALRAELKAAQKERSLLLEANGKISAQLLLHSDALNSQGDELDRMRTALEDAPHGQDCCLAVSLTTCDREASEECKYVFAICLTHHPERAKCDCWKSCALNPEKS